MSDPRFEMTFFWLSLLGEAKKRIGLRSLKIYVAPRDFHPGVSREGIATFENRKKPRKSKKVVCDFEEGTVSVEGWSGMFRLTDQEFVMAGAMSESDESARNGYDAALYVLDMIREELKKK